MVYVGLVALYPYDVPGFKFWNIANFECCELKTAGFLKGLLTCLHKTGIYKMIGVEKRLKKRLMGDTQDESKEAV